MLTDVAYSVPHTPRYYVVDPDVALLLHIHTHSPFPEADTFRCHHKHFAESTTTEPRQIIIDATSNCQHAALKEGVHVQ